MEGVEVTLRMTDVRETGAYDSVEVGGLIFVNGTGPTRIAWTKSGEVGSIRGGGDGWKRVTEVQPGCVSVVTLTEDEARAYAAERGWHFREGLIPQHPTIPDSVLSEIQAKAEAYSAEHDEVKGALGPAYFAESERLCREWLEAQPKA